MKVSKSKNGYYYKVYSDGKKVRISFEDYKKIVKKPSKKSIKKKSLKKSIKKKSLKKKLTKKVKKGGNNKLSNKKLTFLKQIQKKYLKEKREILAKSILQELRNKTNNKTLNIEQIKNYFTNNNFPDIEYLSNKTNTTVNMEKELLFELLLELLLEEIKKQQNIQEIEKNNEKIEQRIQKLKNSLENYDKKNYIKQLNAIQKPYNKNTMNKLSNIEQNIKDYIKKTNQQNLENYNNLHTI